MRPVTTLLLLGILSITGLIPAYAEGKASVELEFKPRTPDQMSAFYEARGFPDAMIKPLHAQCFITVRVTNTGQEVVWLDLARWTFTVNGAPLQRYHRNYWLEKWKTMGMPAASRSTFRWTLLPEQLDYQPGESEGGNIILPRVKDPIHLHAEFATGKDRKGPTIKLDFDNLRCVSNIP